MLLRIKLFATIWETMLHVNVVHWTWFPVKFFRFSLKVTNNVTGVIFVNNWKQDSRGDTRTKYVRRIIWKQH